MCLIKSPCIDQLVNCRNARFWLSLLSASCTIILDPCCSPTLCKTEGAWEPDGWLEQMVRNIENAGSLFPRPVSSPGAWECQECWVHWFGSSFPLLLARKTYILAWTKNYNMHIITSIVFSENVFGCIASDTNDWLPDYSSQSQVQTCINYPLVWEKGSRFIHCIWDDILHSLWCDWVQLQVHWML